MDAETKRRLAIAVNGENIAIFCGAGLSMAAPTLLPSAATLARYCGRKYETITSERVPDALADDLEGLARYLYERNELVVPFIEGIVPWNERFQRHPNAGHEAIADFLLCGIVNAAVSTNYDTHIEDAAFDLGEEDLRGCLDGADANTQSVRHRPLLKIHGCFRQARYETVWLKEQLEDEPLLGRITRSANWIRGRLQGRTLVFVGFWSDWSYLNDALDQCLTGSHPSAVVVVDPSDEVVLKNKAPNLWEWANRSDFFRHVQASGADFLDEFRQDASRGFVRRTLEESRSRYSELVKQDFGGDLPELATLSSGQLYMLRRDFATASSKEPVRTNASTGRELMGALILRLLDQGASIQGEGILFKGRLIRVLNRPGQLLSSARSDFETHDRKNIHLSQVVCVGAKHDASSTNIVRGATPPGIVRSGSTAKWSNEDDLLAELGVAI